MSFDYSIRVATEVDAPKISALVSETAKAQIAQDFAERARERLLSSMTPAAIARKIYLQYEYFLAEVEDEIVGAVATREDTHLYHLFVRRDYQGKGIARRLWRVAKEACMARSQTTLFTVNASLNAVAVYERFGFVGNEVSVDEHGIPMVAMTLQP